MDRNTAKETAKSQLERYLSGKGINTRKLFRCLNPQHSDNNPSMSYDSNRNKCHCFSCGADYDIFDLIALDFGLSDNAEIFNMTYKTLGIDVNDTAPKNNKNEQKKAENEENLTEYYKKCQKKLTETDYLTGRGISVETARKYGVGYDEDYTIYEDGKLKSWPAIILPTSTKTYTARKTDTAADSKTKVRKHGQNSPLFNQSALTAADKPIFIVEGEIDALSVIEVGGEAVGLGSASIVSHLVTLLEKEKPAQPLIIALDNDEAGHKAEERLIADLKRLSIPFYRANAYGEAKDANEALTKDREAFTKAVASAEESAADLAADLMEQEEKEEREEYLNTSTAAHLQDFIDGITDRANTPFIPTGFTELDKALDGGLYEGLYFVGAISSLGKTTLVLQIADQIAEAGEDVLIFSLEMARNELIAKSISRLTLLDVMQNNGNVHHAKTTRGITTYSRYANYSQEEKELIKRSITAYGEYASHIYIHEGVGNIGVKEIGEAIEKHIHFTGKKPVVIIDYVQILAPAEIRATDKQNTDKAVLELKRISRDKKLALIGISSFNRDSYKNEVSMAAFKESGAIEYGSDVLIGLQLEGAGTGNFNETEAKQKSPRAVELVILKNRNGATGKKIKFSYYPLFNYFKEA